MPVAVTVSVGNPLAVISNTGRPYAWPAIVSACIADSAVTLLTDAVCTASAIRTATVAADWLGLRFGTVSAALSSTEAALTLGEDAGPVTLAVLLIAV